MSDARVPSGRPVRLLVAVSVLAVLGLVADAVLAGGGEPVPPRPQDAPAAGTWFCPGAVGPDEEATLSVAAVGERPSIVTVERYVEGKPVADPAVQLTPGDQIDVALPAGHAVSPLRVRWLGGPAAASWRLEGGDAASANCAPAPAPRWHVAGLNTAGGARSFLHLFNPFSVDAVARIVFATPEGAVPLILTENVLVAAGGTLRLPLNDFQPEQPDLGASVEVLSGRLVTMGELLDGNGRALVEAVPEPALEHAFAFGKADGGTSSWLSVLNPGDEPTAVEVRVSDPRPDAPGLGEIPVPAGGIVRIDLAELSAQPDFGVTVASVNEQPVVVTRGTAVRTSSGRKGLALSASAGLSELWALPGGGTTRRQARVNLYNPGGDTVTVDVRTSGGGLPEWSQIVLPANGRASVQLEDFAPDKTSLGTVVEASAPVAAELRMVDATGTLRLWTSAGVPSRAWTGPPRGPAARRDPGLSSRPLPPPADR